jgi:hypothetical protein
MSFGDIGEIAKKLISSKEQEQEKDEVIGISTDTQAIRLLSQGKTIVEVTIKLDIQANEAQRIYKDFLKLKGLSDLQAILENEKNISPFVRVYRIMQENGIKEKRYLKYNKICRPVAFYETKY